MIRPAAQDAAHGTGGTTSAEGPPPQTWRSRPVPQGGDSNAQIAGRADSTVSANTHTPRPRLTDRLVHEAVTGRLSVVVVRVDADGKVGRRSFLTLAAAERARDRAIAAGGDAALVLCHMVPVEVHRADGDVHVPGRHEVRRDEHGHLVPNTHGGGAR